MALTLSQKTGQLAAYLTANRGGARKNPDQGDTNPGFQKLPILISNAGVTYTCFYDPAADQIVYDTGTPVLNQE